MVAWTLGTHWFHESNSFRAKGNLWPTHKPDRKQQTTTCRLCGAAQGIYPPWASSSWKRLAWSFYLASCWAPYCARTRNLALRCTTLQNPIPRVWIYSWRLSATPLSMAVRLKNTLKSSSNEPEGVSTGAMNTCTASGDYLPIGAKYSSARHPQSQRK